MNEQLERCARALHRQVCRITYRRFREGREETEEEAWARRWDQTLGPIKDRYRAEAAAVLREAAE